MKLVEKTADFWSVEQLEKCLGGQSAALMVSSMENTLAESLVNKKAEY
jgi:hypothetical protein